MSKNRRKPRPAAPAKSVAPAKPVAPPAAATTVAQAPRWVLPSLVALYAALTLLLIARVPLGTANVPDEWAHFEYVEHLATRGTLPVFRPQGAPHPGYEFHQPPLYYALCAPL